MVLVLLHRRRIAFFLAAGIAVGLTAACKQTNDLYCCTSADCDQVVTCSDPALPYCDNTGDFPSSDGIGRTCIGDPLQTECDAPNDCTNEERPFCIDNVCVQCSEGAECPATAAVCDPESYLCTACTIDDDCADRTGETRCFVDEGTCVACLEASDCSTATAPICDDADHACRGCRTDGECGSEVCFDDTGACAVADDVIYVDMTGAASGTCTQATPCNTIALALAQVTSSRNVIKVRPGTYAGQVTLNAITVTIVGEGATITPAALAQTAVVISNGGTVTLDGLTIRDAGGSGNPVGVLCTTTGASPMLTMRGTTITNNIGGGVSLTNCNFALTNNWIVGNGNSNSTTGGLSITNVSGAGTRVLDFNTIYENTSGSGVPPGVSCSLVVTALAFGSNIIFNNETTDQVGGSNCSYTFSDIGPTAVAGNGNINTAPTFVDAGNGDYHLESTSAGIDLADPDATLATDIDNDERPQGDRSDMGADELVP